MKNMTDNITKEILNCFNKHSINIEFLLKKKINKDIKKLPESQNFSIGGFLATFPYDTNQCFFITASHCVKELKNIIKEYKSIECRMHDGKEENILRCFDWEDFIKNSYPLEEIDIAFYYLTDKYLVMENLKAIKKEPILIPSKINFNKVERQPIYLIYGKRENINNFETILFLCKEKPIMINKTKMKLFCKYEESLKGMSGGLVLGFYKKKKKLYYHAIGVMIRGVK